MLKNKYAIQIIQGRREQISTHFNMKEFWSTSQDAPNSFELDFRLVEALELLRLYSGVPIVVNSGYRTEAHQIQLSRKNPAAASESQHVLGRAVDFRFLVDNAYWILKIRAEFENRTEVWRQLRRMGISGIGFYDSFIHLDTRTKGSIKDEDGSFSFWNEQENLKKKTWKNFKVKAAFKHS